MASICVFALIAGAALTTVLVPSVSCGPQKRGSCLSLCGDVNNVTCPSGYECQSNGCGHQCYRTTFQQPPGCPMMKCSYNCPLGYVRDENGCEGCECDYSPLLIQHTTSVPQQ